MKSLLLTIVNEPKEDSIDLLIPLDLPIVKILDQIIANYHWRGLLNVTDVEIVDPDGKVIYANVSQTLAEVGAWDGSLMKLGSLEPNSRSNKFTEINAKKISNTNSNTVEKKPASNKGGIIGWENPIEILDILGKRKE